MLKESKLAKQKKTRTEQAKEIKTNKARQAKALCIQQERLLYGKHTSLEGPFLRWKELGTVIVQKMRRVYFSEDDETPMDIENKFGVPVGKIVYDNCKRYCTLKESSALKSLTAIVLPLNEDDQSNDKNANNLQPCIIFGHPCIISLTRTSDSTEPYVLQEIIKPRVMILIYVF